MGWVFFGLSAWLDSLVSRPRPEFTFCKTKVSNWILLFAFAVGVAGMLLFSEYTWLFLAFGVVATAIILFEAFHYARADVGFLRTLRETQTASELTYEETPDDELPQEDPKPPEEQLPLL
jgi:hypothetical protein